MAKSQPSSSDVRLKAKQMREAQARSDRRTLFVIGGVAAVIVIAVVAAVAVVVLGQVRAREQANSADPATLFGDYKGGKPVIVSHLGVGKEDTNLPTVTEYFDYSCHACADLDVASGKALSEAAMAGEFNLAHVMVRTADAPYNHVATGASLVVARQAPDKWVEFHHALLAYFSQQYAAHNGEVITDDLKSHAQVKKIALELGIDQAVVDSFPGANVSASYLDAATKAWEEAKVTGRVVDEEGKLRLGTPELVVGGARILYTDYSPAVVLPAVKEAVTSAQNPAEGGQSAQ